MIKLLKGPGSFHIAPFGPSIFQVPWQTARVARFFPPIGGFRVSLRTQCAQKVLVQMLSEQSVRPVALPHLPTNHVCILCSGALFLILNDMFMSPWTGIYVYGFHYSILFLKRFLTMEILLGLMLHAVAVCSAGAIEVSPTSMRSDREDTSQEQEPLSWYRQTMKTKCIQARRPRQKLTWLRHL